MSSDSVDIIYSGVGTIRTEENGILKHQDEKIIRQAKKRKIHTLNTERVQGMSFFTVNNNNLFTIGII